MRVGILDATSGVPTSPRVASGRQTEDVEIYPLDETRLDVRFFDEPGRFRRWTIPLYYAVDLANWWNTVGRTRRNSDQATSETRFGSVNISILSANQIYFRGRSLLGRPNVTGFQLPRPAVEALVAYCASRTADLDATGQATPDPQARRYNR